MKLNNTNMQMRIFPRLIMLLLLIVSKPLFAEQTLFTTPEEAGNSLYKAIKQQDSNAIKRLFGADNEYLLPIEEVHINDRLKFVQSWDLSHKLIEYQRGQYFIEVGIEGWVFPVPIVKTNQSWRFDADQGANRIRIHRIGYNELSTMQTVQAFHNAQFEYAYQDRNNSGTFEFAQKFISSPGKKDGLYWGIITGEKESPLGLIYDQDYPDKAYHGYYYKILTAQGPHAHGGAFNYLDGVQMPFGFALIAWPAKYGKYGIASFMINQYGVLYEKNLGPETGSIASKLESFNPDSSWMILNDSTAISLRRDRFLP